MDKWSDCPRWGRGAALYAEWTLVQTRFRMLPMHGKVQYADEIWEVLPSEVRY